MLHLFSGPFNRPDGLAHFLEENGWDCEDIDKENIKLGKPSSSQDLSSDHLWEDIFRRLRAGEFQGVWMGTPCTTFSSAREKKVPGKDLPRPVRDLDHVYGFPRSRLSPQEVEEVALGNYFALQSSAVGTLCVELGLSLIHI